MNYWSHNIFFVPLEDHFSGTGAGSYLAKFAFPVLSLIIYCLFGIQQGSEAAGNKEWIGSNSFGGAGLLQTRSARTRADGHFEAGYTFVDPYKRYYITLQGLPWLEGTFRYTEIQNQLYSPFASFSGAQTFKDRGADVTLKLLDETKYIPAATLTLQDGLGTGQYSGEYLTFSKRYYDLDFSGGIAWGYGASGGTVKNPFTLIGERFKSRSGGVTTGGDVSVKNYFSGQKIAFFGGLAYRTPVKGLVLKFEYDPNDFQNEPSNSTLVTKSHFNFGLGYRPFDWLETGLGVERGYKLAFRLTMTSNLHNDGMPKFEPPAQKLKPRAEVEEDLKNPPPEEEEEWPRWKWPTSDTTNKVAGRADAVRETDISRLFDAFDTAGLTITEVEFAEGQSSFVVKGELPDTDSRTAEKIVNIVGQLIPGHSEYITLIDKGAKEKELSKVTLVRSAIEGERIVVDHLFDELENNGLQFIDMDFSHKAVRLRVSKINEFAQPDFSTAEFVFNSLPAPVEHLVMVLENSGQTVSRFEFSRENTEREALVNDLFKIVESEGLEIQEIGFGQRSVEVTTITIGNSGKQRLIRAAKLLADISPIPLDNVTVVAARAGVETERVQVRRIRKGASSGQGWALVAGNGRGQEPTAPDWTDSDRLAISNRLFRELSKEGFSADAITLEGYRVTVFGNSRKYRFSARNTGRAIRAVANNVPQEIEEISIVTISAGMTLNRLTVQRRDFENAENKVGSVEEIWANAKFENGSADFFLPENAVRNDDRYPTMNWLFNPKFRTHIGGPSRFLLYQLFLTAGFDAQLYSGVNITGRLRRNLYNNFDRIRFGSSSVLPHVRTDVKEYLQGTRHFSVDRVQADYFFQPMPEWYGRVSAGIFEEMFGGYSAEVLHRPFKSRFAVGVDINRVWKRGFEQRFKFQEYVVNTGHLNLYYDLPWKNISASAHIGQYLAGDRGVTFMGAREFDSGVTFGLWSTFTNVSAEEFGEGSFDKGFYIRIPFDLFLTKSTTQRGTFGFRPITRDGGAKLSMQSQLHGIVSSSNVNRLVHHWDKLMD